MDPCRPSRRFVGLPAAALAALALACAGREAHEAPESPALPAPPEPRVVHIPLPLEEPRLHDDGDTKTWTWPVAGGSYEVRLRGYASFSEDGREIRWLRPDGELFIERSAGDISTTVRVTSDDEGTPHYSGRVAGRECTEAGVLAAALAEMLPAAIAHAGLNVGRLEVPLVERDLDEALASVDALTSSAARFEAYEVIVDELDRPTHHQLETLLRHAAADLHGDTYMHELLTEMLDLSWDDRVLVPAILEAAATIQSDPMQVDVLRRMLDHSDGPSEETMATVLRNAARTVQSDRAMAALLEDYAFPVFAPLATADGRAALAEAFASIDADGPLRDVLLQAFAYGDEYPPDLLVACLDAARLRLESEGLRAEALREFPAVTLPDPRVMSAWQEAVGTLEDPDHLAEVLEHVVAAQDASGPVVVAALELMRGRRNTEDRTVALLMAVPLRALRDADVSRSYRALVDTLVVDQDRDHMLRRIDEATPGG